ncbi:hypothetical protein Bpfe_008589 [Biomphalaria pfeifferi]|uniref:Uncharacterized protein n=1 Tax=Biomphalaria pfeifferi TaxID=112525 RepID=A0AAD8BWF9_BIOPF|nr:hypothetical protein Bpfe_008589 [Biomphalaria pfeifferi]
MENEKNFCDQLDLLFDVAHQEAQSLIAVAEDWEFLVAQREGRRGYMAGIDRDAERKKEMSNKKEQDIKKRKERSDREVAALLEKETCELSCESSTPEQSDEEYNHDVAAALDRTKVSDREAVYLLASAAHARIEHRESEANSIQNAFSPNGQLVIHWDGKLLPRVTNQGKVDRLAVIVTGHNVEQLLGVPKLVSGTGERQASAVITCIDNWKLRDNFVGMCFDTTVSNTGRHTGACHLIEERLSKDLHLPCRHHILEIVVEKVFTAMKIEASSGPDIAIFKRFRDFWQDIDQTNFDTASDEVAITSFKERVIRFAETTLAISQPRDDYEELLELTIIFLGGSPPKVYVEAWFQAPFSVYAPANDLHLLGQWTSYKNPTICQATSVAFRRHLWYLSELLVYFAFFDERVGLEERERDGAEHGHNSWSYATPNTSNVETWKENDDYQEAFRIVQGLKVVNDCAERGVKLIQEYNSILTNYDQQKQYLLQLVQQHCHVLSDSKKTTAVSGLTGQPKLM